MKKMKSVVLTCVLTMVFLLGSQIVWTNSSFAPTGHTGAPGESTCATSGCHTGNILSLARKIKLNTIPEGGLANGYTPGAVYNLSLNLNDIGANRYGFSMVALDAQNNSVGNFEVVGNNANFMQVNTGGNGRQYLGHKNASSTAAYTFRYTAPANPTNVTFYIIANGANNNNLPSGDQIYVSTYTLTTSSFIDNVTSARIEDLITSFSNYPNPVVDNIFVSYQLLSPQEVKANLFDLQGKIVSTWSEGELQPGAYKHQWSLTSAASTGLYILQVQIGDQSLSRKVWVK